MPTGKMWTTRELKVLREMAAAGHSVAQVGMALGRTRTACRARATREGISFRHEVNHSSARVSLPSSIALRLKMAARERGNVSLHQLARDILSSVLMSRFRDTTVQSALQTGAAVAAKAAGNCLTIKQPAKPSPPAPVSPPPTLPTLMCLVMAPLLVGRL
jgi:hypothetical protein